MHGYLFNGEFDEPRKSLWEVDPGGDNLAGCDRSEGVSQGVRGARAVLNRRWHGGELIQGSETAVLLARGRPDRIWPKSTGIWDAII